MNQHLIDSLKEMRNVDQDLRNSASGKAMTTANYLVYLTDQVHNTRLKRLISEYGLPTPADIGEDGMRDFWLLVQHQDTDLPLQKECLEKCDFGPKEKALLTDRVLVNSGEPQVYGTQFYRDETGKLAPRPIKDAETVDERRAAVGLDSLAEYAERMRKQQKDLDSRGK